MISKKYASKTFKDEGIKSDCCNPSLRPRPNFRSLTKTGRDWKQQGYNVNPNELYKKNYETVTFEHVVDFYEDNLRDAIYNSDCWE